jgi:hypothetical protein
MQQMQKTKVQTEVTIVLMKFEDQSGLVAIQKGIRVQRENISILYLKKRLFFVFSFSIGCPIDKPHPSNHPSAFKTPFIKPLKSGWRLPDRIVSSISS